jgi:Protein of unknown function (DUF2917)
MNPKLSPVELQLVPRALYSVDDASQVRFSCREGALWITLDNDPRDVVIEAGEEFSTAEHRRALVYALQPSRLYVEPTERSAEPVLSSLARTSRKTTMETFSRFQPMPLTKAAR